MIAFDLGIIDGQRCYATYINGRLELVVKINNTQK